MDGTEGVFSQLSNRFARYQRPEDYIDAGHCDECREHFEELANVLVTDLSKEHVGDGAWDPTCFLTPPAFRYYFPGLARIAEQDRDWLEMLLPRLTIHYVDDFDPGDRELVRRLLEHWWEDEATSEWLRLAIESVLQQYARSRG